MYIIYNKTDKKTPKKHAFANTTQASSLEHQMPVTPCPTEKSKTKNQLYKLCQ
jgi:hypothetical protein